MNEIRPIDIDGGGWWRTYGHKMHWMRQVGGPRADYIRLAAIRKLRVGEE